MILDRYTTITIGTGNNALVISPTSENDVGIASGSLMLDQKIVDGDLEFGRLMSSEFSAQLFNTNQDFQGEPITADVTEDNVTTRIFTGVIESSKQDWSNTYRDIIAYDWMYYHREDNIASWWNSFWVSTRTQATVKQIRDSLLTYMGFSALSDTYINDSQVIKNEFQQFTNIKFETIFKMLCEIQLTIPHIKGDGSFELITFGTTTTDISGMYEGSNSEWEDFTTQQITGIGIYDTSSNMVQLVGTNTNVLNIAGNLFLLNMSASQLTTIGNNMLTALTDFTFVPASVKMILSDFSLSLGKKVSTDVGNTYVMQNTYSGSLLVEQTIKGVAYSDVLNGNVPSINDDLITANKIAIVQHDIDGLSTEFGRLENNLENNYSTTTEMNSAIEQSAEGIRTEVSQTYVNQTTYNAEVQRLQNEIDGAIESYTGSAVPTLNNYPANEWTTATERDKHLGDLYLVNASGGSYAGFYYRFDKSGSTYSWVHIPDNEVQKALADAAEANQKAEAAQATADGIADDLSDNYSTTQQMNSAINQKANEITQTVSTTYETKSDATSKLNTANTNAQGYATQAKNEANASTDTKLTNYYTKTQTDSAITQKANEITLNVSQNYTTKTEFGNLEIGGTNLIRNTHDFKGAYIAVPARTSIKTDEPIPYVRFAETEVTWNSVKLCPNVPIELINGKTVTVSAEVRANEAMGSMANGICFAINGYPNTETQVRSASKSIFFNTNLLSVGEWVKLSYTVDINLNNWSVDSGHTIGEVKFFSLSLYDHAGKSMDFRHPKLEIGNKATDWSPAPEDAVSYIEIGGTQMLWDTNTSALTKVDGTRDKYIESVGTTDYTASIDAITDAPVNGIKYAYHIKQTGTTNLHALVFYGNNDALKGTLKAGQEYTVSTYYKWISGANATRIRVTILDNAGSAVELAIDGIIQDGKWHQISFTFTATQNMEAGFRIYFGRYTTSSGSAVVHEGYFCGWKLEAGNTATSWSEHPDRVGKAAATAQTTAVNTAKSYTDAQLQITSSSILSTVEQGYTTKTEFSNLQIGGENILMQTNRGTTGWDKTIGSKWKAPTLESITWLGRDALKVTGNGVNDASSSSSYHVLMFLPTGGFAQYLIPDTEYTISFDSTFKHTRCQFQQANGQGSALTGYISLTTTQRTDQSGDTYWHHVGIGKTKSDLTDVSTQWTRVYFDTVTYFETAGSVAKYANLKIEEGNRATDWSPSPVEMSSKSEVQQLSNMVAVKVNSSGRLVTAALGVDPDTSTSYVKVKADDIDIIANGNIQLTGKSIGITSTNFSVTPAGSITAKAGTIGGWSIDSEKLYKSGTVDTTTYASYLKANELKISAGPSTSAELEQTIIKSALIRLIGQGSNPMKNIIIDGAGEESPGTGIGYIQTPRLVTSLIEPQVDNAVNIAGALLCNSNGKVSATSDITSGGELISGYGIELGTASANAAALIDFHWASNNTDFTARIWQRGENTVDLIGKNSSTWGIWRAASFNSQSSKYVKKNIKDVTEKEARNILKLRPVKFDYKNSDLTNQRGLIAEEVLEIMPEMVSVPKDYTGFNKDEPWNTPSIDYSKFVPYLIKMIQIQQKDIDALKNK